MGIKKLTLLIAPLTALLLAGTACHTEQRPAKLPAPQANAPAMTAAVPLRFRIAGDPTEHGAGFQIR